MTAVVICDCAAADAAAASEMITTVSRCKDRMRPPVFEACAIMGQSWRGGKWSYCGEAFRIAGVDVRHLRDHPCENAPRVGRSRVAAARGLANRHEPGDTESVSRRTAAQGVRVRSGVSWLADRALG